MKLNAFSVSTYQYSPNSTAFKGSQHPKPNKPLSPLKRVAPWVFSGMLMLSGNACSHQEENRLSGQENYKGVKVEYRDVTEQTRDSVMAPVYQLRDGLSEENNFLKGMKVNIARSFKELKGNDSFEEYVKNHEADPSYRGTSFYSDSRIPRRIAVQERAFHNNDYKAMRQTVMHEVGHHFDNFFGHDHNADFAQKWDSVLCSHENQKVSDLFTFKTSKKDESLERFFYDHNALSDKEEFQNALFHDINNLKYQKELPKDLDYYLGNIDIKRGITRDKLKRADGVRSEIYANLFSYISGQNDGNKEKFLECFTGSSKIVEKDMQKFLKFIK